MRFKRLLAVLCILPLWAALSCGSDGPADPVDPNVVTVTLTADLRFVQQNVTIDPGQTVRWVNATALHHSIHPDDPNQPGVWTGIDVFQQGTVLSHTFNVSGETYSYHCQPHLADGMIGVITVR